MKNISKHLLPVVFLSFLFSCTTEPFTAKVKLFNDGVVEDSLLQLAVQIENNTRSSLELDIEWQIATDNGRTVKQISFPYSLMEDTVLIAYAPLHHFEKCGFYRVESRIRNADYSKMLYTNVVMNPEDIRSPCRRPGDFDHFWKRNIDSIYKLDMQPEIRKVDRDPEAKTDLFEVSIESVDGLTIKGWLEIPKKDGKYPALYRVPGYTENLEPIDMYDDLIVFSLNVRDHGNSDDSGIREYEMWVRGLESEDTFFYKNIYLDCFVGLNYLASRSDVDTSRIAVWGGSQGGGLSLLTSAFDKRISLCIADIPFLTDWERYFEISHWYELDEWMIQHPENSWNDMLNVLSYFDTKNITHQISCPVWMGIGLQDDVCPPATSFATFNLIKSPKRYDIYPDQFHSQPQSHYDKRFVELRAFFNMD